MQDLGGDIGCEVELLGQEHRAALLHLLDALVALRGLEPHRVGHHQERPGNLLLGAPDARHVALHLAGPALALGHQSE